MKNLLIAIAFTSASLVSVAQDSLNVSLLFNWSDPTLPGSFSYDNTYNETWGFESGGIEYAIIGTTAGTHIFDVSDPQNATMVEFIPGAVQGGIIVHRDFHDYNGYLYIAADEGASTLQIADLSYLPDSAPVVYDSNVLFARAHNLFIDTLNARMYQCGGGSNQLNIFSLANPVNPVLLLNCDTLSFWGQIGYIHDVYVRNDTAYLNAGGNGFFVVDFSNIGSPQLIGSLTTYPQQGYNHSGWLNEDGSIYAMADETHGMEIKIIDVTDFGNMTVLSTIGSGINLNSIPHNLIFKGDYLYVSYYYDGLYIFDISDPANPSLAGYYGTSTMPHQTSYEGAWGVYPLLPSGIVLVSDMQEGLFVLDVSSAIVIPPGITEEISSSEILISPNPFTDNIFISLPDHHGNGITYELFDYTGKQVQQGNIDRLPGTLNIDDGLPAGIYMLLLNGNFNSIPKKLVKVK